jgi:hypothetical protein
MGFASAFMSQISHRPLGSGTGAPQMLVLKK